MNYVEQSSIDQLVALHRQVLRAGCECSASHPSRNFPKVARSKRLPAELRIEATVTSAINMA